MLNRVVLIGRLANDPELKYTPSGIPVTTFTLAVNRIPNAQGEREADFIPIVAWRQSAEFAANYLTKGRLVAVEGKLQIRSWVAQDGSRRKTAEVVADNLRSLDKPKEQVQPAAEEPTAEEPAAEEPAAKATTEVSGDEFEDPFADE
ncbi:MAG TPA: single-stranded DNA-binding protein [Armatimonadota bacterium]|nr:single-stranded DNA-binding protein [Armatimonadota bacterium]